MKKNIIFFLSVLVQSYLFGQQEMLISQYLFNKLNFNPAYAGASQKLSFITMYRDQYTGFEDNPKSINISGSMPIEQTNHSLGLVLNRDIIGPNLSYNIYSNYSYLLKFTDNALFRIGLRGGLDVSNYDYSSLSSFRNGDPSFANFESNKTKLVIGSGLYFETPKLAISFAVPDILSDPIDVLNTNTSLKKAIYIYTGAEYVFEVSNKIALKPATYYRYTKNTSLNLDFNCYLIYDKFLWIGSGYRTTDNFMIGGQIILNNKNMTFLGNNDLKIGYSYDFANKNYSKNVNGTHEIFIGFDLNKNKDGYSNFNPISPRYF